MLPKRTTAKDGIVTLTIEGNYIIVSVNVQKRTMRVETAFSKQLAVSILKRIHSTIDTDNRTIYQLNGAVTYDSVLTPLIISRMYKIRMKT